jgi:hypothetical protein
MLNSRKLSESEQQPDWKEKKKALRLRAEVLFFALEKSLTKGG